MRSPGGSRESTGRPWFAVAAMLVSLLLVASMAAPATHADTTVERAIERAETRLVDKLESITEWARGKRITGFIHRLCRRILTLDPDNRRARGLLQYRRSSRGGPWVQSADYVEPPDWNTARLPKAEERVTAALATFRDTVFDVLDEAENVTPEQREAVLDRLVDLLPEDATLRRSRGDVEHEGRWVLPETVVGERVRAERAALVERVSRTVKPTIRPDEEALKLDWPMGFRTNRRRVYGNVDPLCGIEALLNMEIGDAVCSDLFGPSKRICGPRLSILLTSRDEARALVQRMVVGTVTTQNLDQVSAMTLPSGEYLAYWQKSLYTRLGGLRSVIDSYLMYAFPGHQRAWITEGIGQRITWYVGADHGALFVSLERTERLRADGESGVVLPEHAAAWPRAAAAVLERDGPRRLAAVMTMRLNAMQVPDILVAYGLAAYLLEARPEHFLPFARATVRMSDANAAVEETLGVDMGTLSRRLRRWLLEIR